MLTHVSTFRSDIGYNMLLASLSYVEQPFKFTIVSRIDTVKQEVDTIENGLKAQLASLRVILNAENGLRAAHTGLHNALATCISGENATVRCLNGYPFDASESIVNPAEALTKHSMTCYDSLNLATTLCGAAPEESIAVVLIPAIEHELNQMGAFKEMLKVHEEMMVAHGTLILKLEKEQMGTNVLKIEEVKAKLAIAEEDRSNFYKGFIYFTLPMHARHRGVAIRSAYSCHAAVKLAEASQAFAASHEYFINMKMHPMTAANECNQVLASLKLPKMNVDQINLGTSKRFADGNWANPPLLEGLFEAAISGNYGPLQSATPAAAPDNFSDNEDEGVAKADWRGSGSGYTASKNSLSI